MTNTFYNSIQSRPKVFSTIYEAHLPVIFPLPIFNVDDPHRTGMDFTTEGIIETMGGKGKLYFETRVWDNDSILQS